MNLKNILGNKKVAFTLAEVVVVMAILSVMMVAFAPVVTKKTISAGSGNNKILFDTIDGGSGVYFGSTSDKKSIVIGDNEIASTATYKPKLLLVSAAADNSATTVTPQIGFAHKIGDSGTKTYTGQLLMDQSESDAEKGNLILGGRSNVNYKKNDASTYYGLTVLGMNAGPNSTTTTTAKNITAIGTKACYNNTGDNTVCIGALSGAASANATAGIYIGNNGTSYTNANIHFGSTTLAAILNTALSGYATTSSVNTAISEAIAGLGGGGETSDIRLKNVGKEYTAGLDEINQLNFYHYTYKRDMDKTPRVGVMAQDLQKVFPDAVSENKDGYLYIRKDDMFYAALNAIKELFQKMTDNSAKIKELEERNAVLEKQVKELQELYIDLAKQNNIKSAKKQLTQTPKKIEVKEVAEPQTENTEP